MQRCMRMITACPYSECILMNIKYGYINLEYLRGDIYLVLIIICDCILEKKERT